MKQKDQDAERMEFLKKLDAAPFDVTDWEAGFLDSMITKEPRSFSPKQRDSIDMMRDRYEGKL